MARAGARALLSLENIDQHQPFFTAEHPFLTPGGWRALDQVATRFETPGLAVAELAAGDVLITAAAVSGETAGALALAPAVSLGHQVLHRLTRAEGGSADSVYNLILDGDHSYVANGFVVHIKGGGQGSGQGAGQGNAQGGGQIDDSQDDENLSAGGTDVVGETLATDTTSVDGGTTESESSDGADTTNDADATSTDSAGDEFSGSSEPAGPDLTASEEQDLIAVGWK